MHRFDDPPTKDASGIIGLAGALPRLTVEDLAGEAVPGLSATGGGHSLIDASASGRYVTQLDAEGFQADFPATGDRGIDES